MKQLNTHNNPTSNLTAYYYLVIASAALGIILWALPHLTFLTNKDFSFLYGSNGAGAINFHIVSTIRAYLPGAFLVAGIGLLFFAPWSRWLFLVCYTIGAIATTLGGFITASPVDQFFYLLCTLVDGAILGLAFLSPLSKKFNPK